MGTTENTDTPLTVSQFGEGAYNNQSVATPYRGVNFITRGRKAFVVANTAMFMKVSKLYNGSRGVAFIDTIRDTLGLSEEIATAIANEFQKIVDTAQKDKT